MPLHVEVLKEIMEKEKQSKGILLTDHLHHDVSSISTKMYVLAQGKTHLVHQPSDLVDLGYTTG
jgi:ABC-type lipopolysaccharide export system ATPase subunit